MKHQTKSKKIPLALWTVSIIVIIAIAISVYSRYEENQNQKSHQEQKLQEARQEMQNTVEPTVPSTPDVQETNDNDNPSQLQKNGASGEDLTKCSIDEAKSLAKEFLISEESVAYLVTKVQNFDVMTFVDSFGRPKNCKLYAPTRQQFKGFLLNRKYVTFQLAKSIIFVDDGEHKLTDQEMYELTRRADIQKIISQLIDDYPEGTSVKILKNVSIENKQSW